METKLVSQAGADKLLTRDERILVNKLIKVHGSGVLSITGKKKKELRLPDPELVEKNYKAELKSKHLYVNISKICDPDEPNPRASQCVKTKRVYHISELLNWAPLDERSFIPKSVTNNLSAYVYDSSKNLEKNEDGVLVPKSFGKGIPIIELPENHVAVQYLKGRGFDIQQLYEQFQCEFCVEDNPEVTYGKFPLGLHKTPKNRIIFPIIQFGINKGWQARYIEKVSDGNLYILTEASEWLRIGSLDSIRYNTRVTPREELLRPILKAKYIIGLGTKSNASLMGFDSARKVKLETNNTIGICEGIFDAAKFGPPFCPVLGAGLSRNQANLIASSFDRVLFACDHDEAGQKMRESVHKFLDGTNVKIQEIQYPKQFKDAGEMPLVMARKILSKYI